MTPAALAGDAKAAMPAACINFLREMFISVLLNSNLSTRVTYEGGARFELQARERLGGRGASVRTDQKAHRQDTSVRSLERLFPDER
jgi:hypothetical protein